MAPPIVFVSHARDDDDRVRKPLLQYLESLKKQGQLQLGVDIGLAPGDQPHKSIQKWIQNGTFAICLLSRTYFTSDYIVNTEIPLMEKRKQVDPYYHIMPLILERCDWQSYPIFSNATVTPNEKRPFKELNDTELDMELERFIEQLRDSFKLTEGFDVLSTEVGIPMTTVFQPEPPLGRDIERDAAVSLLENNLVLLLYGAPGQGKSELARYIALHLEDQFEGRIWEIDVQNESQIDNLPPLIARGIGLNDDPSPYSALAKVKHLVVIDGFDLILSRDDKERIESVFKLLINSLRRGSRLIITCQNEFERTGIVSKKVSSLAREFSLSLFQRASGGVYHNEDVDHVSKFLLEELYGHPYSIVIVGKYSKALKISFDNLRRLWREKWEEIANHPDALDRRGLAASFELTFSTLNAAQRRFFIAMSLFPDGISRDFLDQIWSEETKELNSSLKVFYERGLLDERLWRKSVFRLLGPMFQFSSLKYNELLSGGDNDELKLLNLDIQKVDEFCDTLIMNYAPQVSDHDPTRKNQVVRDQFHNIHASLDRRLVVSRNPSAQKAAETVLLLYWAYHNNMVGTKNAVSSTEDAINYIEKARAVFEANSRHNEVARCLHNTGSILWLRGDIKRARTYLNDAIQNDGSSDEIRVDCRRAFAHMEYKEGSLCEANKLYQEAAILAANLPDKTIAIKCEIGQIDVFRKLAQYEEGLEIFNRIQPALVELPPSIRGNAIRGKAYILFAKGDLESAEKTYRDALSEFEGVSAFGQAHCHRGLGDVHVELNQFKQATKEFDRAMALYDEAGKNPSLGVGLVTLGRGRLAIVEGKTNESVSLLNNAVAMFDKRHLNEPYEFAVANETLGDVLLLIGRFEEAHGSYEVARSYFGRMEANYIVQRLEEKITNIMGTVIEKE